MPLMIVIYLRMAAKSLTEVNIFEFNTVDLCVSFISAGQSQLLRNRVKV